MLLNKATSAESGSARLNTISNTFYGVCSAVDPAVRMALTRSGVVRSYLHGYSVKLISHVKTFYYTMSALSSVFFVLLQICAFRFVFRVFARGCVFGSKVRFRAKQKPLIMRMARFARERFKLSEFERLFFRKREIIGRG